MIEKQNAINNGQESYNWNYHLEYMVSYHVFYSNFLIYSVSKFIPKWELNVSWW